MSFPCPARAGALPGKEPLSKSSVTRSNSIKLTMPMGLETTNNVYDFGVKERQSACVSLSFQFIVLSS